MQTERYSKKNYVDEEKDGFKEMLVTILPFYKSIIAVTLLSIVLALVYGYFATKYYDSTTLLKLGDQKQARNSDLLSLDAGSSSNIEDEIAAFKTRRLGLQALEELNLGTRYYTKKSLKTKELYKDTPFIVTVEYLSEHAWEVPIQLLPEDGNTFRLVAEPSLKDAAIDFIRSFIAPLPVDEKPISYDKVHSFDEKIETPWFAITVRRLHDIENEHYHFTMVPNELMTMFIGENIIAIPYSSKGAIIQVSFQDNVPLRAKEILDALTNAYIHENMTLNSKRANRKLHFIDLQLAAIDKTLKGSAKNLERYKATNVVVDLSSKAQLTAEKLSELETKLYDGNMNIDVMESILSYIENNKEIKNINISSAQEINPTIERIVLDMQEATSLRSDLLVDYTEAHPDVIKINLQLVSLKESLKSAIESSVRSLKKRKHSLHAIIKENREKMQTLPEQERKLARLTRNFMVNEKIYSFLLEKRAETAIIESSTVSETTIFEAAAIAKFPAQPKMPLVIAIVFILGLVIGVFQALFRANQDKTVKGVEDIERLTNIPIYGSIPFIRSNKNLQAYYEALRVIRTNLEFLQKSGRSKLITITSSVPSEGKTTTIVELGKIIAKSNKKVIIIDMDMRRSTMHEKFNLSNKVGISTVLVGRNSLDEVIHSTEGMELDIITSGPIPPNPSELMLSGALEGIIQELKSTYDYVLLDSPPIGLVTDAMVIMRMSDINLITLRANYSNRDFIGNINRYVADHELTAGIILNGVEYKDKSNYGYGYGYAYGSKSGTTS